MAVGEFYCDPNVVLKRKHSFNKPGVRGGKEQNPKWFGDIENPTDILRRV